MDPNQVAAEATAFFKLADADGNGSIDFSEWSAATINKTNLLNEKNLRECFKMFDRDGGGSISASEVAEILGGQLASQSSVWQEIIAEVDTDGNGEIDFSEFQEMMQKFVDSSKPAPSF